MMIERRALLVAFPICVSLLTSGPSRAQTRPDEYVERGIALRRERKDAEALAAFRHAFELGPSPRTLAQIALAEQALNKWLEAERDLKAALHDADDAWIQKNRSVLERGLDDLGQHLASLEVHANVSGAELFINGEHAAMLPTEAVRLVAGPTAVEVRAQGYVTVSRELDLRPRGLVVFEANLASAVAPAPSEGIGGGRAPERQDGARSSDEPSTRRMLAWVSLAGAGVFLAGATTAQLARETLIRKYNDDGLCLYGSMSRMERCGQYKGSADMAQAVALVGFVLAGAAAGTSTYLFLSSRSAHRPVALGFSPPIATAGWQAAVVTRW